MPYTKRSRTTFEKYDRESKKPRVQMDPKERAIDKSVERILDALKQKQVTLFVR